MSFVARIVNFFAPTKHAWPARAAVLIGKRAPDALSDLRVGRFRIRTFNDVADAAQWLHPIDDYLAVDDRVAG